MIAQHRGDTHATGNNASQRTPFTLIMLPWVLAWLGWIPRRYLFLKITLRKVWWDGSKSLFEPSRFFSTEKISHLSKKTRDRDFEPFWNWAISISHAYDFTWDMSPSVTFSAISRYFPYKISGYIISTYYRDVFSYRGFLYGMGQTVWQYYYEIYYYEIYYWVAILLWNSFFRS